mgnify:CR=1 FL=1
MPQHTACASGTRVTTRPGASGTIATQLATQALASQGGGGGAEQVPSIRALLERLQRAAAHLPD